MHKQVEMLWDKENSTLGYSHSNREIKDTLLRKDLLNYQQKEWKSKFECMNESNYRQTNHKDIYSHS